MAYKLKEQSITKISEEIAAQILDKTFTAHERIDGEKLIALTNSRQVNSFIIRSLFNQWRNEVEKLESPYFDFKHEKVKSALKDFMNVLSNHISIDRKHLDPILNTAISDTILISFAPRDFLETLMKRYDRPQELKRQFKYIKSNRAIMKEVVEAMGDFDTIPSVLELFDKQEETLIETFEAADFLDKLDAKKYLDTLFEHIEEEVQEEPAEKETVIEQVVEEAPPVTSQPKEEAGPATINDQFQQGSKPQTLAEKLQKNLTKSLESSLTLNEKFMFQNNLFGGDASQMKAALQSIDQATDLKDALAKANAFNDGWDMESEEVEALMAVLEKRFG